MAFAIRDRTQSTLSEINVTPLVDVMLVLLIIFMVTAPMLTASVDVNLEQASAAPLADAKEHVVVTINTKEQLFVGDEQTTLEHVADAVKLELRTSGLNNVALRGDKAVAYGFILRVLDQLNEGNIKDVGLVMDPPTTDPAPDSPQ